MAFATNSIRGTAMPVNSRRLATFGTALLFGLSISIAPGLAAGDPDPRGPQPPADPPPASTDKQDPGKASQKKKHEKRSEQEFIEGYHAARALALDGKYEAAITAFRALDHDDSAEVANYIGYSNRKLGNYEAAKLWYEKALAADPNHVRTWQYYGMWHVEQGNRLKAQDFLEKIRSICGGTACQEYKDLQAAIEGNISY
jgi:tetratricopeptide (TPR) repeat protein